MEAMNLKIVNANIELQDENKVLKEDKKVLQKRIDKAIVTLKEKQNAFTYITSVSDVIDILEGRVINE